MLRIRNKKQLVENGENSLTRQGRKLTLQCLEHALNAADPKQLLRSKIKLENSCLNVNNISFDLEQFRHIYVLGGGKAGAAMAQATEEVLGNRITAGFLNVPYGSKRKTNIIKLNEASHPIPDQSGVKGTRHILDIAEKATSGDLVICLISGGGSSLMTMPREGITLEDEQTVTNDLLKSGATIIEINIVRKHLSTIKGGGLAKKAHPATVLNLVLSDVMGDPLESIASGPTVSDFSTFNDAIQVLKKYELWQTATFSVRKILSEGAKGRHEETAKASDPAFTNVHNVVIGNNETAVYAALEYLKHEGLKTIPFKGLLTGEAMDMGKSLATFAFDAAHDFSQFRPIAVVAGGETTVTVTGEGLGGRNQELELSAALYLKNTGPCIIASLSTDGIDGPTDAAGAIIDTYTLRRSMQMGLDATEYLEGNDSYHFFSKLADLIMTKPTGTNVNDISVIVLL